MESGEIKEYDPIGTILSFYGICLNQLKMDIEIAEASQMTLSKFKLRAALKLCIDLFFAEWCWTLFSSTNSIINRSNRYFTNLKMRIKKETFTDQIHRDAFLSFKESSCYISKVINQVSCSN